MALYPLCSLPSLKNNPGSEVPPPLGFLWYKKVLTVQSSSSGHRTPCLWSLYLSSSSDKGFDLAHLSPPLGSKIKIKRRQVPSTDWAGFSSITVFWERARFIWHFENRGVSKGTKTGSKGHLVPVPRKNGRRWWIRVEITQRRWYQLSGFLVLVHFTLQFITLKLSL